MRARILTLVSLTTLLLLSGAQSVLAGPTVNGHLGAATSKLSVAQPDQPAPDFTLADTKGIEHKLSGSLGKVVILEWINFDCPISGGFYTRGEMPEMQANYLKKGIVWYSICSSAPGNQGYFTGSTLTDRIKTEKWAGSAYLIDSNGVVGHRYKAKATPTIAVIDKQGVLRYLGAIDDFQTSHSRAAGKGTNYLVAAVNAILAGKPVAVKSAPAYGCAVKYKSVAGQPSNVTK